ncbi:MAG: RodZ domain-containing protein, partial [Thermosynechococcaceae cyanobacterium]
IYTRGMIRRFANTLGLDGAKLVASLGGSQPAQKNLVKAKRSGGSSGSGGGLKPFHLYLLYIVIILAAGSGLSYMINQSALTAGDEAAVKPSSAENNSSSSKKDSPNATSPTPSPVASPASVQDVAASSALPKPNAAPLRVDMSLKQDAWVEIVADGKTSYSGILTAGTSRTITAQKKLVVRSGNAGGVLLAVNKKPAQLMGQPGAIKELILEPENTDQSSQAINLNESADG